MSYWKNCYTTAIKMRSLFFLLALCISAVLGESTQQRIAGGSQASIGNYPYAAAALYSNRLACGGVILNNRSILTAARCFFQTGAYDWHIRLGSADSTNGGTVYSVADLISHPEFNYWQLINDIGIYRTSTAIQFTANIQPGSFAGANYQVNDNQIVWTYGWGASVDDGPYTNLLQHVQIRTVNQEVCKRNYNILAMTIPDTVLCAGNIENGGEASCTGDFGGALLHNGIVIGIFSRDSAACGMKQYPGVYSRVPKYIDWITSNA